MGRHEGNLSNKKLGNDTDKKWSDLWYIFKPYGYEKTLAEMTDEERKNGKDNVYFGNYLYFLEEDERRTLAKFENYKNQQKQIEKMKESIKTLRKFGEIAKNEMFFKRAKSIEKRLEKMDVLERVNLNSKSIDLKFNMENRSGNDVLKIDNLTKKFDYKIIFENANQTILDYFLEDNNFTETQARTKLAKYGFRGENVFKKIYSVSGGEKVRLLLIKLIQKDINFLILDEPTNHIDIDTRELLEEALNEYSGTVLFVSHDRFFINKLANRILNIEDYKIKSYYGNYDDFIKTKI